MSSTEEAGAKKKGELHSTKKSFVSTHIDPAMKSAIFNYVDVGDATQYVKSMETIATYIGRSGKEHPTQLRQILIRDLDILPAIHESVGRTLEQIAVDEFLPRIYLVASRAVIHKQDKRTLMTSCGSIVRKNFNHYCKGRTVSRRYIALLEYFTN